MNSASAQATVVTPRNILIAEDEVLIAMVLEDMLDMLGHRVIATPSSVAEAEAAVAAGGFDLAILDVNLGHESVFPVADILLTAGTPIIFATGSHPDSLPERFAGSPVLEKPYAFSAVETAVGKLA